MASPEDRSGRVTVVGAGLAGSEAAWTLARAGIPVDLLEMKPARRSPVQRLDGFAELVCSNSLRSDDPLNAVGLLHEELRRAGSLVLSCADGTRVPAGGALAVDREAFSLLVTDRLSAQPLVRVERTEVAALPDGPGLAILATGPLTSDPLAEALAALVGPGLAFYDAIAPVVSDESVDRTVAFAASRWGKGEGDDYLNLPMDEAAYRAFVAALLAAEKVVPHGFEEPRYFEGCLPIEVMAERGLETLRHGPMKPVGLDDPRTGRWPYAAVQLRQDTLAGELFNMVGFQTRLKWNAQQDVFRLIPGLEKAVFARLGSIHRNTYVEAPAVLDATLAVKRVRNLWLC